MLAPEGVKIDLYHNLGALPLFNPDIESTDPPSVLDFRAQLTAADGWISASPDYADGGTGVLKSARDLVVGSEELDGMLVAPPSSSIRAPHAYPALAETSATMGRKSVATASLIVPLPSN